MSLKLTERMRVMREIVLKGDILASEIADRAHVSRSTVTRSLRNEQTMKTSTFDRVWKAFAEICRERRIAWKGLLKT